MANDPAYRLRRIVSGASGYAENKKVREVWGAVLNVDSSKDEEIFRRLIAVYNLFDEVELFSDSLGLDKPRYLNGIDKARKAVFPVVLDSNWKEKRDLLKSSDFATRLEFCSEIFSQHSYEEDAESELSDIATEVDDLFEQVFRSDMDLRVKRVVLTNLENIRRSISEYKIRGQGGLREALEYSIGSLADNRQLFEAEKEQSLVGRFGRVLSNVDRVTAKSMTYMSLIDRTKEWIPLLDKIQ